MFIMCVRCSFCAAADIRGQAIVGPRQSETSRAAAPRRLAEFTDRVVSEHVADIDVVTDDQPGDNDAATALGQRISTHQSTSSRLGVGKRHFAADTEHDAALAGVADDEAPGVHV